MTTRLTTRLTALCRQLLNDAQGFAERLLAALRKSQDKFEVRSNRARSNGAVKLRSNGGG